MAKDTRRSQMVAPPTHFGKKKAAKAKAQPTKAAAALRFAPAPNFDPNVDPIFAWYPVRLIPLTPQEAAAFEVVAAFWTRTSRNQAKHDKHAPE